MSLDSIDLDDILSRAEVAPEANEGGAGSELLESFKVATFDDQDDGDSGFWERIVPLKDRKAALKPQIEVLGPRKRNVSSYAEFERAHLGGGHEGDEEESRRTRRQRSQTLAEGADLQFDSKDIKRLVNAIKAFGEPLEEYISDIIHMAHLQSKRRGSVLDLAALIVEEAREKVAAHPGHPKVKFKTEQDVVVNATTLLQRLEDLAELRALIAKFPEPTQFQLQNVLITPWEQFKDVWRYPRDDYMLLVGIAEHGYGQWEAIRTDERLKYLLSLLSLI